MYGKEYDKDPPIILVFSHSVVSRALSEEVPTDLLKVTKMKCLYIQFLNRV